MDRPGAASMVCWAWRAVAFIVCSIRGNGFVRWLLSSRRFTVVLLQVCMRMKFRKMARNCRGSAHRSLTYSASVVSSTPIIDLVVLLALISLCGILGNMVGYWTGRKIGPAMYNWRDRFLFKKKYLYQAHEFYQKHGGVAVIGARFLPIIRICAHCCRYSKDGQGRNFIFLISSVVWHGYSVCCLGIFFAEMGMAIISFWSEGASRVNCIGNRWW